MGLNRAFTVIGKIDLLVWASGELDNLSKGRKIKKCRRYFDVFGQLLSFNGQLDLLIYLRDHSAIFPGFGDDFETLGMSVKLL